MGNILNKTKAAFFGFEFVARSKSAALNLELNCT